MGLLGRIVDRILRSSAKHRGARLEAEGKLEAALEAYLAAGQLVEAARIIVARAHTEPDPTKRIAMLELAASRAPKGSDIANDARTRAVLLRLDLVRSAQTKALTSELLALARELESTGLLREAGEAYGLAGDGESQARVLVACGAINALEVALESEQRERSDKRNRETFWKEVRDLDAIGQRLACLRRCEQWLNEHLLDESVAAFARSVRERLVQHGPIPLRIEGQLVQLVVEHPLTIGRSDASLILPSPALSRQHLAIQSSSDGPTVEDLGSRNGTFLAGARIDAPLPIGDGLDLKLGDHVPCRIEPWPGGGVKVSLPGQVIVGPLGPLQLRNFKVNARLDGVFQLQSGSAPPILNGLTAESVIDLAYGDQVQEQRDGPVVLEVVSQ